MKRIYWTVGLVLLAILLAIGIAAVRLAVRQDQVRDEIVQLDRDRQDEEEAEEAKMADCSMTNKILDEEEHIKRIEKGEIAEDDLKIQDIDKRCIPESLEAEGRFHRSSYELKRRILEDELAGRTR